MRVAKYTDADKANLLKQYKDLTNKEAAKAIGISEGTLYNWKSKVKIIPTPKSKSDAKRIKALTVDTRISVSKVKSKSPVTKPASIKKVIKALESIKTSMQVVEGYLNVMVA